MNFNAFVALLLSSVLGVSQTVEKVPRVTINGDRSAGPAEIGSSQDDLMQSLLNWGIEHSDPEKLKELMKKYQENNLTIKDVYGEDVLEALFVNEGEEMQKITKLISDFSNATISDEDLEASLERLLEFVEQVDNAGNLHRMGGLKPLLELAVYNARDGQARRSESVRTLALWTLGVASQNNAPVQSDLFDLGGLTSLMHRLPACNANDSQSHEVAAGHGYCGKLIFAISALVRNNETIQGIADREGLFDWLIQHGLQHTSVAIAKKALGLLDIVLSQNAKLNFIGDVSAKRDIVADALLAHIRGRDTDTAEKAARLVNRFVTLRPLLFRESFSSEFIDAMAEAMRHCETNLGVGEMCEELNELGKLTESVLAYRDVSDDDL